MKRVGFTLVELLIMMGVIAVLVVTILVSLNPSEAQKKARDTKRMKDLAIYEALLAQYIQDGKDTTLIQNNCPRHNGPNPNDTTQPCITQGQGNIASQPCTAPNWLGVNLCDYTKTLPIDPSNERACTIMSGNPGANPQPTPVQGSSCYYQITVRGSDYKIGGLQESRSNIGNVVNDGGNSAGWVEKASSPDAMNMW